MNYLFFLVNLSKLLLVKVFLLIIPINKKQFLIFGGFNGDFKVDNSFILFKKSLLLSNVPSYYICNNYDSKIPKQYFLKKDTMKAYFYLLLAKKIYISHSESDVASLVWKFIDKKYIFIQHGIIGIKKLPDYESKIYDGFLCSNEYEKYILISHFKTPNENIIYSVLPRFELYDSEQHVNDFNRILIMFTWRDFKLFNFEYYIEEIENILTQASKLKKDIFLSIHPLLSQTLDKVFSSHPQIKLVPQSELSSAILNCEVLITDYSSVCWDFLYQGKPVVFYQFDYIDYVKNVGIYNKKDFFGLNLDHVNSLSELLSNTSLLYNIEIGKAFRKKYKFFTSAKPSEVILNWGGEIND